MKQKKKKQPRDSQPRWKMNNFTRTLGNIGNIGNIGKQKMDYENAPKTLKNQKENWKTHRTPWITQEKNIKQAENNGTHSKTQRKPIRRPKKNKHGKMLGNIETTKKHGHTSKTFKNFRGLLDIFKEHWKSQVKKEDIPKT